jgi:hypothetical protein
VGMHPAVTCDRHLERAQRAELSFEHFPPQQFLGAVRHCKNRLLEILRLYIQPREDKCNYPRTAGEGRSKYAFVYLRLHLAAVTVTSRAGSRVTVEGHRASIQERSLAAETHPVRAVTDRSFLKVPGCGVAEALARLFLRGCRQRYLVFTAVMLDI